MATKKKAAKKPAKKKAKKALPTFWAVRDLDENADVQICSEKPSLYMHDSNCDYCGQPVNEVEVNGWELLDGICIEGFEEVTGIKLAEGEMVELRLSVVTAPQKVK